MVAAAGLMLFPLGDLAAFLLRPVLRALEDWAERIRKSRPLEPTTARLIRERAARETSDWASRQAISFAIIVTPLTGGFATLFAVLASRASTPVQVLAGAVGGLIGLSTAVVCISLVFLLKAIPTVREEKRRGEEERNVRIRQLEENLARPQLALAAIEAHQLALSSLADQIEHGRKYPGHHQLGEPVNAVLTEARETLERFDLIPAGDAENFPRAVEDMSQDELQDAIGSGRSQLSETYQSLRRVLPMFDI